MSKNLTRKGLAIGAVVALGSSLFAGTPASAAELLTLTPSAGSTYNTINKSTFTLQAGFDSSLASGFSSLKYRVQNLDANGTFAVTLAASDGSDAGADDSLAYGTATAATDGGSGDVTGVSDDDFVVKPLSGDAGAIGVANTLALTLADQSTKGSFDVTAWLDVDGDNTIDSSEATSAKRTVKFVDIADVAGSVSLVAPVVGDTVLKANVTLSDDINTQQVDAGDITVEFGSGSATAPTKIGSYADSATAPTATGTTTVTTTSVLASNRNDVIQNTTTGNYEAVFDPYDTDVAAGTTNFVAASATIYAATLYFAATTYADGTAEGTISSATVATAVTTTSFQIKAVGSTTVKNTTTAVDNNNGSATETATGWVTAAAGAGSAKKGANSGTFKVTLGTDAATPLPVADQKAVVTVTPANVSLSDGITVGGKTVSQVDGAVTFTATTDATGSFTFAWSALAADASDTLTIQVDANGASSSSHNYVLTFVDPTYTLVDTADVAGKQVRSITSASKYTIDYTLVDQFGALAADGVAFVSVAASANNARTTAAAFTFTAPVVAGKASVAITDNGVGAGSYTLTATATKNSDNSSLDTEVTSIKVVSDLTPAKATLATVTYGSDQRNDANADGDYSDTGDTDNTTKLVLSTKAFTKFDARLATSAEAAPEVTAATGVTVGATITNAAGSAVAGTPVTLSANGFLFQVGSSYFLDSATVLSDADGKVSAVVWSHVGGTQSIKITAGAATAAQSLKYAAGASGLTKGLTFNPASKTTVGRALDLPVLVLDTYGNPSKGVTVTYEATGAGYLSVTSATTNAAGKTVAKLILGSSETGVATVTATVTDADGVEQSVTKTILVGVKATIVKAATSSAVVKNASGATIKIVRGTKSATKVATSNSQKVTLKGGSGTVKVYVNGVKVASK